MRRLRRWTGFAAAVMLACFGAPGAGAAAQERPLSIAAASSLTEAVSRLAAAYNENTGVAVRITFAASSTLARQTIRGAPFDVLISAHPGWMDAAVEAGAVDADSVRTLAQNRLAILAGTKTATSAGASAAELLRLALDNGWRVAIADPDHVPAGIYAREAMIRLGVWPSIRAKLVPLPNVRAAVAFVARGETPIGIAYATDASISPDARLVARFDPASHAPIRYVAGVASENEAATGFVAFVLSGAGQGILADLERRALSLQRILLP